ncbi:MAG: signal peptidase I [Candidatus Marinimicrobia bacterium]|nr:signal peptidase I [Candidatus Neomarinimicrobiota bacterium]
MVLTIILFIGVAPTFNLPFKNYQFLYIYIFIFPLLETMIFQIIFSNIFKIIRLQGYFNFIPTVILNASFYLLFGITVFLSIGIISAVFFSIGFFHFREKSIFFGFLSTVFGRLLYNSFIAGFILLLILLNIDLRISDPDKVHPGYILYKNTSQSMTPAIHQDDLIVVRAAYYNKSPLLQGDVALIQYDQMYPEPLLKRVVGLPGDTISIQQGQLLVNSTVQPEPYVDDHNTSHVLSRRISAQVVPAGHIFVLGDNRDNSYDSRYWGPLPDTVLIGKAQYILWSDELARIGALHRSENFDK